MRRYFTRGRTALLAGLVTLLTLAGAGAAYAVWTAHADAALTATTAKVGIAQTASLTPQEHAIGGFEYRPSDRIAVGTLTVTNQGTRNALVGIKSSVDSGASTLDAQKVLIAAWAVTATAPCAPDTGRSMTESVAGYESLIAGLDVDPGASAVICVQTAMTAAEAGASGNVGKHIAFSVAGTLVYASGSDWRVSGTPVAVTQSVAAASATLDGVQLAWGFGVSGGSVVVNGGLTITPDPGESFGAGATVTATLATGSSTLCTVTATTVTTSQATIPQSSLAACGTLSASSMPSVSVHVSAPDATFAGPVQNTTATMVIGVESQLQGGARYLSQVWADVRSGATVGQLVGQSVSVVLLKDGATVKTYSGVIGSSLSASNRIWAQVAPESNEADQFPTVMIDTLAYLGSADWVATGSFDTVSFIIGGIQHLPAATSTRLTTAFMARISDVLGSGNVSSGTDPIDVSDSLTYTPPSGLGDYSNGSTYCYTFTVRNTSDAPFTWTLTYDTSLPPLWGVDPRQYFGNGSNAGAPWGFTTQSYDPATHLWVIQGEGWNSTLQPGAQAQGGYCEVDLPVPAPDPAQFAVTLTTNTSNSGWYTGHIQVTTQSKWNLRWTKRVDLAELYPNVDFTQVTNLQWSRVVATKVAGTVATYDVVGTQGDTVYVSNSPNQEARNFDFVAFSPVFKP